VAASGAQAASASEHSHEDGPCLECLERMGGGRPAGAAPAAQRPGAYTIRQANELSDFVRTETLRTITDPTVEPKRFVDTDFFAKQLEYQVTQTPRGRALLDTPAKEMLPQAAVAKLARHLGLEPANVTVRDAWLLRGSELAEITGVRPEVLRRTRLRSLGVTLKRDEPAKPGGSPGAATRKPSGGSRRARREPPSAA
jgi:hypothetical protein